MQETQEKSKERKNKILENNIENKKIKNRLSYRTRKRNNFNSISSNHYYFAYFIRNNN